MSSKKSAEHVSAWHPDKMCDQISDLLLDEYLRQDPFSRVAIETVGGHRRIALFGEVTSKGQVDHERIVRAYYRELTGLTIDVQTNIVAQSPEIAQGVDNGGAGDQGIMVGYACAENEQYIPQETYLARKLLTGFSVDAKSQVTLDDDAVTSVVLSVQEKTAQELRQHVANRGLTLSPDQIFANNTGAFTTGGFEADSGCTGRKIVVDAYGPRVPVGGGAFSGKDPTKVDRCAAYMARWIALQLLHEHGAREALVRLGYVIGKAEPLLQTAVLDGKEVSCTFDCRPQAIIDRFALCQPIYLDTAKNGHFGRMGELPWEQVEGSPTL